MIKITYFEINSLIKDIFINTHLILKNYVIYIIFNNKLNIYLKNNNKITNLMFFNL